MSNSNLPANLSLHDLQNTYGVLFIGYVISMILYGFTFFQTYVYFSRYPKDDWFVKWTVTALGIIDTATSALASHALYFYLITLFPFAVGLSEATSTFCAEISLATLAVFNVQVYYATRIWSLSHSVFLFGAIAISSSAGFVLGITMASEMFEHKAFTRLAIPHIQAVAACSQALTFISSLLIMGSLFFYLRPSRKPLMKPLDGWFDKCVAYTLTRGSIATVIQLAYFLAFTSMPDRSVWIPFHLAVSKLYINSLLTMLNSRDVSHGQGVNEEESLSSQHHKSATTFTSSGRSGTGIRFNVGDSKPGINIEVSRTVECDDGDKMVYDFNDSRSFNDRLDAGAKKGNLEP
jgi:hypothetical protein